MHVRSKKINTAREKAQLVVGIRVKHGVSQLNVLQSVVTLVGTVGGIFCPPMLVFESLHVRSQNINTGVGGKGHSFLSEIWVRARGMGMGKRCPTECDDDCRKVR